MEGVPKRADSEELLLFPAESSTVTVLPGVARVVHSKASCTVHWQESGRSRPGPRDLPAAHILGIQPGGRGAGRPGKGAAPPAAVKAETQSQEGTEGGSAAAAAVTVGDSASANANPAQSSAVMAAPLPTHSASPVLTPSLPAEPSAARRAAEAERATTQGDADGKERPSPGAPALTEQSREEVPVASPDAVTPAAPHATLPDASARADVDGGSSTANNSNSSGVGTGPGTGSSVPTGRSPERIREEGWSAQEAENVTLAELYLMLGKPGKLQLEYEWQTRPQEPVSTTSTTTTTTTTLPNTHSVLRCLLRLVASEVNPKPVSATFHL